MEREARRIGPIGTASRLLVGGSLLYLAVFDGAGWGLAWYDAVLGLAVLPGVAIVVGLVAGRYASGPLRFTGAFATMANCFVIVALVVNPYTVAGTALFYGTTLVGAALRAQPGCEVTVLSNWILGRDDQLGCPVFSPIDRAEMRALRRAARRRDSGRGNAEPRRYTGAQGSGRGR